MLIKNLAESECGKAIPTEFLESHKKFRLNKFLSHF